MNGSRPALPFLQFLDRGNLPLHYLWYIHDSVDETRVVNSTVLCVFRIIGICRCVSMDSKYWL